MTRKELEALIKEHKAYSNKNTKESIIDLNDADLSGIDLSNLDLRKCSLTGADFSGSNLSYSNLSGVNLIDADFRGSNLEETNLSNANLQYAYLTDATLKGTNLRRTNLLGIASVAIFSITLNDNELGYAVRHSNCVMIQLGSFWGTSHEAIQEIIREHGKESHYQQIIRLYTDILVKG
jgi:uncharacterized protein YjbI with pentapeptide repeats